MRVRGFNLNTSTVDEPEGNRKKYFFEFVLLLSVSYCASTKTS